MGGKFLGKLQTMKSSPAQVSQCHPGLQRRHSYKVILVTSNAVSGGIMTKGPHYPVSKHLIKKNAHHAGIVGRDKWLLKAFSDQRSLEGRKLT